MKIEIEIPDDLFIWLTNRDAEIVAVGALQEYRKRVEFGEFIERGTMDDGRVEGEGLKLAQREIVFNDCIGD